MAWLLFATCALLGSLAALGSASLCYRLLRFLRTPAGLPSLQESQKVVLVANGKTYRTAIWRVGEEGLLWLLPPLQRGLPISFQPTTQVELHLCTKKGLFSARAVVQKRCTKPFPLLGVQTTVHWKHSDRRCYPRISLGQETSVRLQSTQENFNGWLQDMSRGGLCVHTSKSFPIGTSLLLSMPDSFSLPTLEGQVVACDRVLHGTAYEYALRIAFSEPLPTSPPLAS